MIKSILDTDLYKLSMMNAVCKLYPDAKVRYKFINRGTTHFPESMVNELKQSVIDMKNLYLTYNERSWIEENLYFFDSVFRDILRGYTYNPDEVKIEWDDGELKIDIEGYWHNAIMWEVPLMALVSELYFKHTGAEVVWSDVDTYNERKGYDIVNIIPSVYVADFGTRRRFSYKSQDKLVNTFKEFSFFAGTSNVHFAQKYGLKAIGTQAHEWFMFHAAKYGFHQANTMALGRWVDVYNGNLGIALTDTFTTQNFFENFDTLYGKLFDGLRHDSGDPVRFGRQVEEHYAKLGIDPSTKTLVFSDGLTVDKIKEIESHKWDIKRSYGVGTHLTNDIPGITPLNIVIKMTAAQPYGKDWIPTIKLSDDEGKHTGDPATIKLAKQVMNIK